MFLEVEEGGKDRDEEAVKVYLIRFIADLPQRLVYGLRDGVPLIKLIVLCFVLNFFARNPSIPQMCKCSYLILFSSFLSYQVLS